MLKNNWDSGDGDGSEEGSKIEMLIGNLDSTEKTPITMVLIHNRLSSVSLVRFQVFVEPVFLKRTAPKLVRCIAKIMILGGFVMEKYECF